MKAEDEDFDVIDDGDEDTGLDLEAVSFNHRNNRKRRGWRDIERLREQKEIDRLLAADDWFEELDHA